MSTESRVRIQPRVVAWLITQPEDRKTNDHLRLVVHAQALENERAQLEEQEQCECQGVLATPLQQQHAARTRPQAMPSPIEPSALPANRPTACSTPAKRSTSVSVRRNEPVLQTRGQQRSLAALKLSPNVCKLSNSTMHTASLITASRRAMSHDEQGTVSCCVAPDSPNTILNSIGSTLTSFEPRMASVATVSTALRQRQQSAQSARGRKN
jgi:hypothetical protein